MDLVLAITGDSHYHDWCLFSKVVRDELERFPASRMVTGDSHGSDVMAYRYATEHGIPIRVVSRDLLAKTAQRVLLFDGGDTESAEIRADAEEQGIELEVWNIHKFSGAGTALAGEPINLAGGALV